MRNFPVGWVETKLGNNIVDIAMGPFGSNLKVDSFIDAGVPIIKGGNLSENFVGGNFSFVSEEKASSLRRSVAHAGDIIITHRGTLGQVSLVPEGEYERYVTSQSQLRFTPDEQKVDKNYLLYLLYFLKSRIGQYELLLNASQVGVPAIATPTKAIKGINLCLPPLPEQKSIAEMLSSFDEKIELLREQNKTLETLAQTIFKEWFVNFNYPDATGEMVDSELGEIPKGWRVGKLKDICEIKNGFAFKSKDYVSSGMPVVRTTNFRNGTVDLNSPVFLTEEKSLEFKSYFLDKFDFLLVMVGASIGKNVITPSHILPALQNQNMWNFKPKDEVLRFYNIFLLRRLVFQQANSSSGSARDFFRKDYFYGLDIAVPDNHILTAFSDMIKPAFEKIDNNIHQIKTLSKTRASLLPKLMSGQVRI